MSTLSNLLPVSSSPIGAYTPVTSTTSTTATSSSSSTSSTTSSANSLTANDFIQFMVTQLENQDPLDPTDSNQMLTQMSEIGQLESSTTLETDLTGMVQQNQIASASAMIGKQVQGTDPNNINTTGTVTAVQVTTNGVNLSLDNGDSIPMGSVTSITNQSTTNSGS